MATAPHDAPTELVSLAQLPHDAVRALFQRERKLWLQRLHWDTREAAETAASAVASHVLEGVAVRRGSRYDGFLAVQSTRPLTRACSAWLAPSVGVPEAADLVAETLVRTRRSPRVEGQLVGFDQQATLDAAFAANGFTLEPREYLVAPLAEIPAAPGSAGAGARLVPIDSLLLSDCARVLVAAHRGGVEARINSAFRTDRGAQEYLTDIREGQGCGDVAADASLAFVRDGRVGGFCLATMISAGIGHVPQICVDPAEQAAGVGSLLLAASLRALKRRGATRVTLSVSTGNERAASWYARIGFVPATRFSAYHRDSA